MSNPWKEIKTPLSNYNVRRAEHQHPFDFFWGKDIAGDYLFLFQCDAAVKFPDRIPSLHGIEIIMPPAGEENKTRLILQLNNTEDWDIFYSLCRDLIQATGKCNNEETVVAVIVRRLERWHTFLKKNRSRLMSEAEQKGLIGELLFLRDHVLIRFPVSDSLSFWQGPLDAPQDFCIGNTAVEIKCQLGTSKPHIRISSVEQLNTQLSCLYLFVVTVGKSTGEHDNAVNLPIITGEIRGYIQSTQPSALDLFDDLLLQTGYIELPEYDEYHFTVSSCTAYEVKDEFPRFHPEDIPEGVINTAYEIMLERCIPYEISLELLGNELEKQSCRP